MLIKIKLYLLNNNNDDGADIYYYSINLNVNKHKIYFSLGEPFRFSSVKKITIGIENEGLIFLHLTGFFILPYIMVL